MFESKFPRNRTFIEALLHLAPCGLFEDAAEHFVGDDESHEKTDDEILADALAANPDDKLLGFLLRLVFYGTDRRPSC